MKEEYGYATIRCKMCGAATTIGHSSLEVLTQHSCPVCNIRMTDREVARMKMHLYLLWLKLYEEHYGTMVELFDYEIKLLPQEMGE